MGDFNKMIRPVKKTSGRSAFQNVESGALGLSFGSEFPLTVSKVLEKRVHMELTWFFSANNIEVHDPLDLTKGYTLFDGDAFLEAFNPKYFWFHFIFRSDILEALKRDERLRALSPFLNAQCYLDGDHKTLLSEWKHSRGQFYKFAHVTSSELAAKKSNREQALQDMLYVVYMSAFRYLDAALTGTQRFKPSAELGGLESTSFNLVINNENVEIKLGLVDSATYGETQSNMAVTLLEDAYLLSDPKGKNYQENNPIEQIVKRLSPILAMVGRSNYSNAFLLAAYLANREFAKLNECSFLPEWDLQTTRLNVSNIPYLHMNYPLAWCQKHKLSPAWMDMLGFYPYRNAKIDAIIDPILGEFPEIFTIDKEALGRLVLDRTWAVVLRPILNRTIQLKVVDLFRCASPIDYNESVELCAQIENLGKLEQLGRMYRAALQFFSGKKDMALQQLVAPNSARVFLRLSNKE